MMSERYQKKQKIDSNIPEERVGRVKGWGEMKGYLPKLLESEMNLLQEYFGVQKLITGGKKVKARGKMNGLDKKTGFRDFEDDRDELFRDIDIAVRGDTNRRELGWRI